MKKATITVGRFNITFDHGVESRSLGDNRFSVWLVWAADGKRQDIYNETALLRDPMRSVTCEITVEEAEGIRSAVIDHIDDWKLDSAICPKHRIERRCPGCIGSIKSKAKAKASAENGLRGGRPYHLRGGRPKKTDSPRGTP